MTVTVALNVPKGLWLTANDRMHWAPKSQRIRALRFAARVQALNAIHAEGVRFRAATVHTTVCYPTRRRQDPANAAPTVKAIIDGCVDAHLLPDDDAEHLRVVSFERGAPTGHAGLYRIVLTFTGEP